MYLCKVKCLGMNASIEFDNQQIKTIKQWIDEAQTIAIVAHRNADGDAVGSLLGLFHILSAYKSSNRRGGDFGIYPILPNGCPRYFGWLPGSEKIESGELQRDRCEQLLSDADLLIGVDFNATSRIDFLSDAFGDSKARKLLIDHHHAPALDQFDLVVSRPGLSSASELVYWLTTELFGDSAINQQAAKCLYTGICTDTGSFSYSCEDASLYHAAAALVGKEIDAAEIHNKINNTFSIARMRFFGFAISQRLRIFEKEKFAYIAVSLQDQRDYHVAAEDCEGLVNYTLMMENIEVGALIREETSRIKVSLRSKYDVNVNAIARDYFGGGGHIKAAGADSNLGFEATVKRLEEIFVLKQNH